MAVTQYIGARYVPVFADPAEWSSTKQYEPLTIVLHGGNSFTSKQFVPVGIDIDDTNYWLETGNFNAQVETYRQEVGRFAESIQEKAFAFDTVADMQDFDGLYVGAICHTNGFHASGDGGAAWYVVSASGEANGTDIISLHSALKATFVVTSNTVTPEMFGAIGNGVHNDAQAFLKAIEYGHIVTSNKIYYLDNEIIDSDGTAYILPINDGCSISGVGTLLFPNNAISRNVGIHGLNMIRCFGSVSISDITIDLNGNNNIVPAGVVKSQFGIYGDMHDSRIERVTIKNSTGRNMIYINGNDNTITACRFLYGGTNNPLNVNQNDFSFVYVNSANSFIEECYVDGIVETTKPCGGIEIHASNCTITNCTVKNVETGINVAGDNVSTSMENIRIEQCKIEAQKCMVFWGNVKTTNVIINSCILIAKLFTGGSMTCVIRTAGYANSILCEDVIVTNCIIKQEHTSLANAGVFYLTGFNIATFFGNSIYTNARVFVTTDCDNLSISGNKIICSATTPILFSTTDINTVFFTANNLIANDSNILTVTNAKIHSGNIQCEYTEIYSGRISDGIYHTNITHIADGSYVRADGNIVTWSNHINAGGFVRRVNTPFGKAPIRTLVTPEGELAYGSPTEIATDHINVSLSANLPFTIECIFKV